MNRTAKLGLAAALVVVVVAVLAWASIASLAGTGPTAAATAFFKTLGEKGAQAAYASTSTGFQQVTPGDAFAQAVQARGLGDYKSSDWSVRSSQGALAEVTGAVTAKSGAVTPVDVRMVKGGTGWQVLALNFPQGGLAQAGMPMGTPGGADAGYAGGPQPALGAPSTGEPPSGAGMNAPPVASYSMTSPVAPQGAPPQDAPPQGAPMPGYAPSAGYGGLPEQAAGRASVSSSRVARMCGRELMRNAWAETVQLHCPDAIGATIGATTRCQAVVNGRRAEVTATMTRYDARRDDAQLSCRLD